MEETTNIWNFGFEATLAQLRAQGVDSSPNPVKRRGKILFGKTGKDEASVGFGTFGLVDLLTVTRIDIDFDGNLDDAWTIQSFGPGEDPADPFGPDDTAVLFRHGPVKAKAPVRHK